MTVAGARLARTSVMTPFAVRPAGHGGGWTAAWCPWSIVALAVAWNLLRLRLAAWCRYLGLVLTADLDQAVARQLATGAELVKALSARGPGRDIRTVRSLNTSSTAPPTTTCPSVERRSPDPSQLGAG
jgi:hypothetical protein